MHGWMDAWMHGCMDAWMDGWMDGWIPPTRKYFTKHTIPSGKSQNCAKYHFP